MRSVYLSLVFLFSSALSAQSLTLDGDRGTWRLANNQENADVHLMEWVRPGESLQSWSELYSTLLVKRISSPLEIAESTKQRLLANCPGATWNYHRQLPDDVLYESSAGRCLDGSGNETEIARLTKLPGTRTFKVSYSVKSAEVASAERRRWRTILDGRAGTYAGAMPSATALGGASAPSSEPASGSFNALADRMVEQIEEDQPFDVDAAMRRCEQAPNPIQCIEAVQQRLNDRAARLAAGNVASAASGRGGSAGRAAAAVGDFVPGVRRVSMHNPKPSGGPAEENYRFLSTTSQLYAVAHLDGARPGQQITFRWVSVAGDLGPGEVVFERSMTIERGYDSAVTYVTFRGLNPLGRYRVDVFLDGRLAGQAEFEIVRAGQFG